MTEAEIIDGKNNYEIEHTRTQEHTSDIDDKHSSSSDSPGETTGDFDGSSTSFRHEEDDDIAGDNSTNRSPSAENDENRSIVPIHEKDAEIKRLTNENKRLRSVLCEKEIREKELVEELERHAELVERQQNQLDDVEGQLNQRQKQIAALRQQLQRTQHQLNSAVLQQNQSKNTPPVKAKPNANGNHDEAAAAAFLEELCAANGGANGGNSDEVCAALNTFIEKNRSNNAANVPEGDDVAPELIEYLNKLIAENSASSNNQTSNNDESNSLISMLLDQYGSYEGGVGTNGMTVATAKSASGKPFSRSHGTTVRDFVGMGGVRTSGQTFYRGSAASSANAASAPAMSRDKFSQHIDDGPTISTAPAASNGQTSKLALALAASSSGQQLNGISGSSAVIRKPSFSQSAPQQSVAPSSSSSNAKPLSEEEQRIITKMQDRIAANVAHLGNRPLNTFVIAHQCKRLMLAYNIGQRLFAKAVMCQVVKSQGSLSELLSKPRAWHKLTDKGREAFRRIYGWLSDDAAIELLCQLSPRRVAMPGDRIEHPSGESLLDHGDSAIYEAEFQASRVATFANNGGLDESLNGLLSTSQYPDDDDELKAPSSHLNKTFSSPGTSSVSGSPSHASAPSLNMNFAASPASVSASMSSASSMKGGLSNGVFGGSLPTQTSNHNRWRHDDIPREKIIGIFEAEKAKLHDQVKQNADEGISLANSFIGDESTPNSPRNANIANMAQILRGDLISITQAQFEKYPTLDTEEVVKEVKDYLSHHSISQRQFGEAVLGLSQGSVSDLLARPKSWSMLTHKGREPFIRMRIFLDEHAHEERPPATLNQSNDKIEGLNFGMEEECRDTPEPDILHKALMIKNEIEAPIFESAKPAANAGFSSDQLQSDEMPPLDTTDLCRRVKEFLLKNSISQRAFGEHVLNMTSGTVSDLLSRPKSWQHLTPKGREAYTRMLRFMGDERAMDVLRSNAIARAMNNSGVVAAAPANGGILTDLLPAATDPVETEESNVSYPSITGPTTAASATVEFITSPLPVTAFSGVSDRLSQFLIEQSGTESDISINSTKRKASFRADGMIDNGISLSSGKKIPRFQRTVITDEQKEALFFIFSHEQRPSAKLIDHLAARLNLSSRTVTNWFHNHRTRQKAKETKLATEAAANGLPPPPSKPNPLQVIDPSSKEWYTDLVLMLSQNAGSNNNNIVNQNGGYLMSGEYSSFLDASLNGDDMDETMSNGSVLKFDDITNGDNDHANGHYGGGGGGVELEEEEEAGTVEQHVTPKYGSLSKVIARMHDRLSAESS